MCGDTQGLWDMQDMWDMWELGEFVLRFRHIFEDVIWKHVEMCVDTLFYTNLYKVCM